VLEGVVTGSGVADQAGARPLAKASPSHGRIRLGKMQVSVFGAGYVGLVTATCLAEVGHSVVLVDHDARLVEHLRRGKSDHYEPKLEELLKRNLESGRLVPTTDLEEAFDGPDCIFIAVGTPPAPDGAADLRAVDLVARTIGEKATRASIVVMKSTVPVGTCRRVSSIVSEALVERGLGFSCEVVSNPEFLKEGNAIRDFMEPDHIVVGADAPEAFSQMRSLYAHFAAKGTPILELDTRSSELAKYGVNAMLATRISFMNELASLADHSGADIEMIRQVIGSDPRIGPSFLRAGGGYGGSCFPKDVKALIHAFQESGLPADLLHAVESVNNRQKNSMVTRVIESIGGDARGKVIGIWGVAFKPETDDVRNATSIPLIRRLSVAGAEVRAFDPIALSSAKPHFQGLPDIHLVDDQYAAVEGADVLVLVTEWEQFRAPDFHKVKSLMKSPVIVDSRNLWDPAELRELGFAYEGIGRGKGAARIEPPSR
jgi:UDPglucose 6-dehydrogenase